MDFMTFALPAANEPAPRKELDFTHTAAHEPVIKDFPFITWWAFHEVKVSSLRTMARALHHYANIPRPACVVRGERIHKDDAFVARRAFDHTKNPAEEVGLRPSDRRWLSLDIDKGFVQGDLSTEEGCKKAALELLAYLPASFHGCEAIVHFSNTSRNQKVKGHIWLWLPRPICDESLREWAKEVKINDDLRVFDPAFFSPNQAHYIADPLIIGTPYEGWTVAKRWHFIEGREITNEQIPASWKDSHEWNKQVMARAEEEHETRMRSFVPKRQGNSASYAEATMRGLCNDILATLGHEGERHEAVRRASCRAMRLKEEGKLNDSHLDEIKEAAYAVIPRNRHRDVDRLFKVESLGRSRSKKEMPMKSVAVAVVTPPTKTTSTPAPPQDHVAMLDALHDLPVGYIPDQAIPVQIVPSILQMQKKWSHPTMPFWDAIAELKTEWNYRIKHCASKPEAMASLGYFIKCLDFGWESHDTPILIQLFPFCIGRQGKDNPQ